MDEVAAKRLERRERSEVVVKRATEVRTRAFGGERDGAERRGVPLAPWGWRKRVKR